MDFLRVWLKDQGYVAFAYMTGILPIKKYGSHSALNMFTEYSMTEPGDMAAYFGFTENKVKTLCMQYGMDFEEAKAWYDGISESVHIPNKEVSQEYVNAISTMAWKEVITSVEESRRLLESLWNMDGEAVVEGINYDRGSKKHTCMIEKMNIS